MKTKQLFIYEEGSGIEDAAARLLAKHGYIPLKVKDMRKLKLLQPIPVAHTNLILQAALETITDSGAYGPTKSSFGQRCAQLLLDAQEPKS